MTRTQLAGLQAFGAALVLVGGAALVLGAPLATALVAGLVAGVLGGGLLLAAASRAGTAGDDPRPDTTPFPRSPASDTTQDDDRG